MGVPVLTRRDLPTLIDAARLEVEKRMNDEAERVGGRIAESLVWFELRSLSAALTRAGHHAAQIERRAR